MINQDMQSVGLNPAEYMIGQGSVNNLTGLQEFGFLSKLFKKVKKVVKKVAPIAVSFIPGVGPLAKAGLTAVAGKASGMDTKDALLAGLTAGVGAKLGGAGTAGKVAGETAKKGIFGGTLGPRIRSGLGSVFNPTKETGIFGGKLGPNIRRGIGNIFGGGLGGGQQEVMYEDPITGEIYSQSQVDQMLAAGTQPDTLQEVKSEPRFKGLVGPDSFADKILNIDPNKGTGPLSFLQGSGGQKLYDADGKLVSSKGLGLGGAGGIAGLAALFGLATKKAAEKTEGGLRDVRLSTRPDLLPQATFQGFDVGVRPGMFYGGRMDEQELDMRMGGPSVGPGTETSDDIPAMLSDGEFVMTAAANKGLGGFKIEKNKDSLTIFPTGKPDREQGFKNNDKLMKFFEGYQDMMS
jgi:hypothetical protein